MNAHGGPRPKITAKEWRGPAFAPMDDGKKLQGMQRGNVQSMVKINARNASGMKGRCRYF
jgi:hypothetical protein